MDLNHLHLHVRDLDRSHAFYERHFGFHERVRHGEILFLRNDAGFDLALVPDPDPAALPGWFHFGFRLPSPEEVRALFEGLRGAGATLKTPLSEEPDFVWFRAADPDGVPVEIYWEP